MRPAWPGMPGCASRTRHAGPFTCPAGSPLRPDINQRGMSTTMGVVVGASVPPAGSTVTPTASSLESPIASTAGPGAGRAVRVGRRHQAGGPYPGGPDEPQLVDRRRRQHGEPRAGEHHGRVAPRRDDRRRPAGRGRRARDPRVGGGKHRGDLGVRRPRGVKRGDVGEHATLERGRRRGGGRAAERRRDRGEAAQLGRARRAAAQVPLEPGALGGLKRVKRVRAGQRVTRAPGQGAPGREARNPHHSTPRQSRSRRRPSRIRVLTVPSAMPSLDATCG